MSSHKTVKMSIEIPADKIGELQDFMKNLTVKSDKKIKKSNNSFISENKQLEISGVLDSRHVVNGFSFLIQFKNGEKTWIHDKNCNCEYLISRYLHSKGIKTAYLVCRVSTKEQASTESTSLEAQESEMKKNIDIKNFDRVKTYKISQSAYKSIPDALVEISEAVEEGDGIFIWRVDRLSRNIVKYLNFLEELNSRSIYILSTSENLCYQKNKLEFIQSIVDAQKEAQLLGKRVKLSNKRKRERGDEAVGCLSYGKRYKRILNDDGTTNHKIVVEDTVESKIISKIKQHKKVKASWIVANELNETGILKRGRKWTTGMVTRIK